ncbi:hypothetical protein C8Q80DRAFT_1220184 [Daedaleopsis nitida]|nr:hypothetical protein C8Q80DRAFT_1220184 [Daedaleopsis nitida]
MSLHRLTRHLPRLQRYSADHLPCRSPCHNAAHSLASTSNTRTGALNDSDSQGSLPGAPTAHIEQFAHLKRPTRGGQDLSQRYKRLERSLRGKHVYGREIQELVRSSEVADPAPYTSNEDTQQASTSAGKVTRRIFRGFVIPEIPKPPADDECCMSGCAVCVYDLYEEARNDYIQAIKTLRSNLEKMSISESEWPADVRHDWQGGQASPVSKPNVALSAFEQLEQALKAKREIAQQSGSSTRATGGPGRAEG